MNRRDLSSGLFWLGISIFTFFQAHQLGVGGFSTPGPGFVLFWSSLIFGTLSIVLVVKSILGTEEGQTLSASFIGLKWSNALVTVFALVLYASLLNQVGFLLMTFGLMIFLYALGKCKPWITVGGAFVTIMVAYIIFHFGLQIQFPRGILGW